MLLAVFSSQPDPSEIRLLRSTIVPSFQKYACSTPLAVSDSPTTWPKALTLFAELLAPPSVPRSIILPPLYRKACGAACLPASELPTTCPRLLIPEAALLALPSVPRSLILPALYRKACSAPAEISELPTTCERSLRLLAELVSPPSVPRSLIAKWGLAGGSAGGGEAMRDSA